MALRIVVVSLALSLALTYGAVIPQDEDFLYNSIQAFLADPESYASAIGMTQTRAKRSSWDKEFNLNSLGANIKIKYLDPNNQLKGGRAEVTIDNLKKYVKRARSTYVHFDIMFNGGDNAKDGLFELENTYELHHNGVEKGVMKASREMKDGLWVTHISNENTQMPDGKPIFQNLKVDLKSDRKTMMQGTLSSARGYEYTLNVDRQPGKQVNAVLEGNGRVYTLEGRRSDKKIEVDINANDITYFIVADFDFSGNKMEVELSLDNGGAGKYKVKLEGNRDLTDAGLEVTFNDSDFAKIKAKGKLDKSAGNAKYEVRYSVVGLGDGKLRFSRQRTDDGGVMKAQYLPKTGLDLKFEGKRTVGADKALNMHATLTRGGENYLEYNIDMTPSSDAEGYEMNVQSQFDVNEKSTTYEMFCTYGCFKRRSLKSRMYVLKDAPYKVDIDVNLYKDDEEVLMVDINTKDNPYVMKVVAPRLLPKLLPTGRESIEFEADHKPGQYLHVKSNTNAISSFNVDKLDGDMRKIELNGKELFKAAFKKGANSISQTTELPDGRALTTTISWDSDNMKENKVNINLDGTERKFNGDFEWNVLNKADMWLRAKGNGENARWGKYEASRELKVSSVGGVIKADLSGRADFEKFPLPTPIYTSMDAMLDTNSMDYAFSLSKTFNGKPYGVTLKNGKFSLTL